jgi:hypothetical protein
LLPRLDLAIRSADWTLERADVAEMKQHPVERRHLPRLASVGKYVNFGAIINGFSRLLVPLVAPGEIWRIRYVLFNVNIQVVPRLSGSGQIVEIDVGTASLIRTWDDFLIRYLLPSLPPSAISFVDTFGNVMPLSANPAVVDVHVTNLQIPPGFLPPVPGLLDCDAVPIGGLSNRRTLLASMAEHLQWLAMLVDGNSGSLDEFKNHVRFYVGASLASAYRMRFANPDGNSGYQAITEFGFDNTAGISDSDTEAILSLFRIRTFTAGRTSGLELVDPVLLVKAFVDKRAYKIVESGLFIQVWSDLEAVIEQFDPPMYGQFCMSEVRMFGGARLNACTSIARRFPDNLELLKRSHQGTLHTTFEIIVAHSKTKRADPKELFSLFNLLSSFGGNEILEFRGVRGNSLRIWRGLAWVQNLVTGIPLANEIALLNPASNFDLLYAISGGAKLTLTVNTGPFMFLCNGPTFRIRASDEMKKRHVELYHQLYGMAMAKSE